MPHKLVEGLDCGLLLPAPPRGILDKILHHLKVLKGPAPVLARKLRGVSVDKSTFLTGQRHTALQKGRLKKMMSLVVSRY